MKERLQEHLCLWHALPDIVHEETRPTRAQQQGRAQLLLLGEERATAGLCALHPCQVVSQALRQFGPSCFPLRQQASSGKRPISHVVGLDVRSVQRSILKCSVPQKEEQAFIGWALQGKARREGPASHLYEHERDQPREALEHHLMDRRLEVGLLLVARTAMAGRLYHRGRLQYVPTG